MADSPLEEGDNQAVERRNSGRNLAFRKPIRKKLSFVGYLVGGGGSSLMNFWMHHALADLVYKFFH